MLTSWCSAAMDPFMAQTKVHLRAGYSNTYSYVKGTFGDLEKKDIVKENSEFLSSCIRIIREVSPLLLVKILEELPSSGYSDINFIFSDTSTDGTSFVQPNDKMAEKRIEIVVNLSKSRIIDGKLFSMVPTLNEVVSLKGEQVSMIYETPSPFWLTIAHELIHLKHWLDEKAGRTVLSFDAALHNDMKLISYTAAKEGITDLVMAEFNKCRNPYRMIALIDNLNSYFKKPEEPDAIKGMIKCFANFEGKKEEELSELLEKDRNQVFLTIVAQLETSFAFTKELFVDLKKDVLSGNIRDITLITAKKLLFSELVNSGLNYIEKYSYSERLIKMFPEIFFSVRAGMNSMWPELEERRTVFGPDIDDISEASIRMKAELPLRYLYQDRVEYFVESMRAFEKSVSEYLINPRKRLESSMLIIRHNTFPTSMSLMPLVILHKIYGFNLKDILNDCGNLQPLAKIFGYRVSSNFLKIFE